jgi:class III poly(R)-hydroxyalkanoic acid synthase PhaE subunit
MAGSTNVFADMFTMQMNLLKNMSNPSLNPFADVLKMNPFATMMSGMSTGQSNGSSSTRENEQSAQSAQSMSNQLFALYKSWQSMYNAWASAMGKMQNPLQGFMAAFPNPVASDAFNNMSTMANTYFRLFEFWTPMMKAMQERGWNEETFKSLFDPEQYSRIMNAVFNFVPPDALQSFSQQVSNMMAALNDTTQATSADISEMMQQSMQAMSQLASGNLDAATKTYVDMMSRVQKPLVPITRMLFIGKDRTAIETSNELLKHYAVFASQYGKIQQLIAQAGQQAMQQLTRNLAEAALKNEQPKTYDEFFKQWIKANEAAFDHLFKTDEYSRLQGEMQTTSMYIRKHTDTLMELALSEYPVATRSELDEAYESIQELKRKVRALERKVDEQERVIAGLTGGAAVTASAKTSSSKASLSSTTTSTTKRAAKK